MDDKKENEINNNDKKGIIFEDNNNNNEEISYHDLYNKYKENNKKNFTLYHCANIGEIKKALDVYHINKKIKDNNNIYVSKQKQKRNAKNNKYI